MIEYDAGTWSIVLAISLKGSVFPNAFLWAFPCSVLATALHMILRRTAFLEVIATGAVGAEAGLSGFTFVLGFLIVFRSQQAYARWWEGGTLLQQLRGEWFNSYSCLLAFCNPSIDRKKEVQHFQHQLVRLYSLLYGCALQQVSCLQESRFDVIDLDGFDETSFMFLQESQDRCEVVLQWIQRLIVDSNRKGLLDIAPPILSRVFNELGNGIVNLNNARKIKEFPIPFPLTQMITVMLMFQAVAVPLLSAITISSSGWAALITFTVVFSNWCINYIALELEMPFGDDDNDLPLLLMQRDMNGSLCTLIRHHAQHVPDFHFDEDKHTRLFCTEVDFDGDLINYKDRSAATLRSRVSGRDHDEHVPGHACRLRVLSKASANSKQGAKSVGSDFGHSPRVSRRFTDQSHDEPHPSRQLAHLFSHSEHSVGTVGPPIDASPSSRTSKHESQSTSVCPLTFKALEQVVGSKSYNGSPRTRDAHVGFVMAVETHDVEAYPPFTETTPSSSSREGCGGNDADQPRSCAAKPVSSTAADGLVAKQRSIVSATESARQGVSCPQEVALPPVLHSVQTHRQKTSR